MPQPIMLIDSENCMNCKACVVACQQRNHVPYGYSRNWIKETPLPDCAGGMKFQPGACMQCLDAPCVSACPTAATYKNGAGIVLVDPELCIGCGACIDACPYGARFRHPVTNVADKCDYCEESGLPPACVSVCPVGCRIFGDLDDPASAVSVALAGRTPVYVTPQNVNPRPSLAYLDATTPQRLPPHNPPVGPLAFLGGLSQGLAWVGGLTLVLLGGVFGRQILKSSEAEDREMAAREDNAGKREKQ